MRNKEHKNLGMTFLLVGLLVCALGTIVAKESISKDFKYDSDLLDALGNQALAEEWISKSDFEIFEIDENGTIWTHEVLVRLRDNSGIVVEGTKEEKIELMRQRDELFKPKIDKVLSTLSEDEFKLYSKLSNGFGGQISKQGFEKLINDERIREINWPRIRPHFLLDESASLINATYVWNPLNYTGQGVNVCVIDTGVDTNHPDLLGRIVDEKCYCSLGEIGGCCPGGLGSSDSAEDQGEHGTHNIGIIASQNETYKGIAYDSGIYAVRIADEDGVMTSSWSDIENAINWCINQGVNIISMSLGGGIYNVTSCQGPFDDELNDAYNAEISVIVASGNGGSNEGISYPACRQNAISVGSVYDDSFLFYSHWKTTLPYFCIDLNVNTQSIVCHTDRHTTLLDLLAPGCKITSTKKGGGFKGECGTSVAAPHVAGAVALMLQKNSTLTPDDIKMILQNTGKDVWDPKNQGTTYPRIDAAAAVEAVQFNNCTNTSWSSGSCGAGDCSGFQREHTRTATPSGCVEESKCEYDETCISGSTISVCKAGAPTCDYDNIQDALDNAGQDDLIEITDGATYEESLVWTASGDYIVLNCDGATIAPGVVGIKVPNNENRWSILNCIFNGSVGISVNGSAGGLYEIFNSVFDVEETGIRYDGSFSGIYIKDNIIANAQDEGVFFKGSDSTTAPSGTIRENTFMNNNRAMDLKYSRPNQIDYNNYEDNTYGIYLRGYGYDLDNTIEFNNFSYNDYGIYINNQEGIELYNNNFCPYNFVDIETTSMTGNTGAGNRCEKPYGWSDGGVSGCTYYCDTSAEVELIYPNDNSTQITQENISLVFYSRDNINLLNVTLYHNISGIWHANQTKIISGTSNVTVFTLNNVPTGTNFIWNGLVYDNMSRGGFADLNFTVEVIVDNTSPSVNIISPLNQTYETSSIDFNVTLDEGGICRYSLDGGVTNTTMSSTNNRNFTVTDSSMNNGDYIANFYCQDGIGNMNDTESVGFTINVPNDIHKYLHKNSSGSIVAWLGNEGNIVLKGRCYSGGSCDNPGLNSFIFRNSTNDNVAFINSTGDMCIVTGDCSDQSATCNPTRDAFIIRNSSNYNMSYIDFDGDLCLTGGLFENSNL